MVPQRNAEEGGLRLETDFPSGSPSLWHSLFPTLGVCLYLDVSEGDGNKPLRDYLGLFDDSCMSIYNLNSFIIIVTCFMGVSIK